MGEAPDGSGVGIWGCVPYMEMWNDRNRGHLDLPWAVGRDRESALLRPACVLRACPRPLLPPPHPLHPPPTIAGPRSPPPRGIPKPPCLSPAIYSPTSATTKTPTRTTTTTMSSPLPSTSSFPARSSMPPPFPQAVVQKLSLLVFTPPHPLSPGSPPPPTAPTTPPCQSRPILLFLSFSPSTHSSFLLPAILPTPSTNLPPAPPHLPLHTPPPPPPPSLSRFLHLPTSSSLPTTRNLITTLHSFPTFLSQSPPLLAFPSTLPPASTSFPSSHAS